MSTRRAVSSLKCNTTLRGFTGHEMLDDVGLVHMNARIYDPQLGRFLQADSEVENDATQGLNRYSCCLNNPLSLTDPTGYRSKALGIFNALASIAISVFLPGSGFLFAANSFESVAFARFLAGVVSGGGLQGGLEGAFTAGLFYGIGNQFAGLKKFKDGTSGLASAARTAAKVLTHAAAGGTISVLQGGKFGHGFVSAGVTEALAPTISDLHSDYGAQGRNFVERRRKSRVWRGVWLWRCSVRGPS
jgi:RHS repeat-associated protein